MRNSPAERCRLEMLDQFSRTNGLGIIGADIAAEVEVEAMRAIRLALDPKRIMNPRVLF